MSLVENIKDRFNEAVKLVGDAWYAPKDLMSKSVLGIGIAAYVLDLPNVVSPIGETALLACSSFVTSRIAYLALKQDQIREDRLNSHLEKATTDEERTGAMKEYALDKLKWGRYADIPIHLTRYYKDCNVDLKPQSNIEFIDAVSEELSMLIGQMNQDPQRFCTVSLNNTATRTGGYICSDTIGGTDYTLKFQLTVKDRAHKKRMAFLSKAIADHLVSLDTNSPSPS